MYSSLVAGIDIGGSHITVALIDTLKREILPQSWRRLNVDSQSSAENIIATWCKAIEESLQVVDVAVSDIGIAMPGPFDYANGISFMQHQNKYDALYGLNVKELLASRLAIAAHHIVFTNDAACYLQGEMYGGVAKDYFRVMGFTLGTGLGSAIALNGEVEDANLWCSPYKDGIAEDYLSSRWFAKRFFELSGEAGVDVKTLVEKAESTAQAQKVFEEFGENLGNFLLPVINQHQLQMVVLGGNIAHAFPLFSQSLYEVLQKGTSAIEVKKSTLGENASIVGAARFCLAKEDERAMVKES